jgi:hypothetical protein
LKLKITRHTNSGNYGPIRRKGGLKVALAYLKNKKDW